MLFISPQKLFSFSRYFTYCLDFLPCSKMAELIDKVNFKIYDVAAWLTNNCNSHIPQYLEK